jgi:hypothetical protein
MAARNIRANKKKKMKLPFLVTGLIILFIASFLMIYTGVSGYEGFMDKAANGKPTAEKKKDIEQFVNYFLEEAGGYGKGYEPMGAFDNVKLVPNNGQSQYRNTLPNEPMMGPAFEVGPDSLFMFKNNQCKPECCGASYACDGGCVCSTPEQRKMINMRGGNRTVEDGF